MKITEACIKVKPVNLNPVSTQRPAHWGTVTTILMLSRHNCREIMTQNLCLKQETLLQPQEEDIKRFSKGEQTSVFFF